MDLVSQVNRTLRTYNNYTIGQKIAVVERGLRVFRSGIYSIVISTVALLLN